MGSIKSLSCSHRKYLVCFTGQTELWWLRFLHPAFRDCFALIQSGENWILYNPLSHQTDIQIYPDIPAPHLRRHLEETGHYVVELHVTHKCPQRLAAIFPYSCVEAVKRVLGIHDRWTRTPYQLHKLLKEHLLNKKLDFDRPASLYSPDKHGNRHHQPVLFSAKLEQKENNMGGLFSSPSPPAPPPPPTEEENRKEEIEARKADIERKRRGRRGTIKTGWRGVLNDRSGKANATKDRLGE